jgi:hypothetical protein
MVAQHEPGRQARHDCADRTTEHLGDFLVGEALDVSEHDGLPEDERQRAKRAIHVAVHDGLEEFLLGVVARGPRSRRALRRRVEQGHVGVQDLPVRSAHPVEKDVPHDREQPGPTVRARIEPMEAPERAQERLLHDILRFRTVPRQPEGGLVERVQVDEGLPLELVSLSRPALPEDRPLSLSAL